MSSGSSPHSTLPFTFRTAGDFVPNNLSAQFTLDRGIAAVSGDSAPPSITALDRKNQKSSNSRSNKPLLKSVSTPHLRGPIRTMSDSELDKKRNKLGYQRISIACAHCRRRKIRCLLAEDDPDQRCQNCIRLKKDCHFYPVDQQAALDAGSEASSKSGAPSAPSSAVSTSPPQLGSHAFSHQQRHPYGHGFQSIEGPPAYQGVPIPPSRTPPAQGGYPAPEYPYVAQGEPSQQWSHDEYVTQAEHVPMASAGHVRPIFTNYNPSIAADTSPFPTSTQPSPSVPQGEPFSHAPGNMSHQWQQHTPVQTMPHSEYPNHQYDPSYAHQQVQGHYMHGIERTDSRLVPVAHHGPPPVQQQYIMHHGGPDQRSASVPGVTPYQPMQQLPSNWYSGPPPFHSTDDDHHTGQQSQGGYGSRSR